MHLVLDNPIIIRVHVMVKGLTIIQPKFDMEKTLGLGVELEQCSTSQMCPLLLFHGMWWPTIAFIDMQNMILLILRKVICLNKRILLLLRKVVFFVLFCHVGFFVPLGAPRCIHNVKTYGTRVVRYWVFFVTKKIKFLIRKLDFTYMYLYMEKLLESAFFSIEFLSLDD